MLTLSKSKYCSAVQCPKMLWLKKNMPEQFDESVLRQSVLDNGNAVGDLAMELFGDFIEVPYGNLGEMIAETKRLLAAGVPIITEASFSYKGLFCSADILKNLGDNRVELYEVKSSSEVKDIYYHDVAYQAYVLTKLGCTVEKACLVHVNTAYVRHGDLELDKLFAIEDLTEHALAMQAEVEDHLAELEKYMQQTGEPDCEIGTQCFKPYDCGFWKFCTRNLPSPNVFDISVMQLRSKLKHYRAGIVSFEDYYRSVKKQDNYMQQVDFALHDCPPCIQKAPLREFMEQLCKDIPENVCVTAYNMSFEKGRIKELAALFPDLHDHLMNIHDHIVDLMKPFQSRWYYAKEMQGSYSIKYVLPALYPDDPALDYHNLEGVHNGTEAMDTFTAMASMSPDELETARTQLLKYCGLDTFAMVKVWEKLTEAAQ